MHAHKNRTLALSCRVARRRVCARVPACAVFISTERPGHRAHPAERKRRGPVSDTSERRGPIAVEHGAGGLERICKDDRRSSRSSSARTSASSWRRPPCDGAQPDEPADGQGGAERHVDRRCDRSSQDQIPRPHPGPVGSDESGGAQMVRVCSGNTLPHDVRGSR